MDSVGQPASLEAFVTGGAGGDGGSDFTGSVMRGVMSAVTPCASGCLQQFADEHHSGRQRRDGKSCRDGQDFTPPRYGVNQELFAQPRVGRRLDPMLLHDAEPGPNRSRHRPHRFEHDS